MSSRIWLSVIPNRPAAHRVTFFVEGRARARHFKKKREAEAFAAELRRERREQGPLAISPGERRLLHEIREAATARGLSLESELQGLLKSMTSRPAGRRAALSVADAVEEFMTDCLARNLRPHTLDHYERMLTYFAEGRETVPVHSIDGEMVIDWIRRRYIPVESQRTARTPLRRFLRWCHGRGYRSDVPEIDLQLPKDDERLVEFLAPKTVEAFFGSLNPNYWAAAALGFFAGIRPIELQRLDWTHINSDPQTIDIPGSVAKTRQFRRLHDLPENLWAWLNAAPGKKTGPVVPGNYRNFRRAIKGARGDQVWPHDAMRHSFATYGYHRGLEWCIDTMGHVSGYRTFVKHYKGAASKAASVEYFSIQPPAKSAEKILKDRRPKPNSRHP